VWTKPTRGAHGNTRLGKNLEFPGILLLTWIAPMHEIWSKGRTISILVRTWGYFLFHKKSYESSAHMKKKSMHYWQSQIAASWWGFVNMLLCISTQNVLQLSLTSCFVLDLISWQSCIVYFIRSDNKGGDRSRAFPVETVRARQKKTLETRDTSELSWVLNLNSCIDQAKLRVTL
jgi:hypothetical protein